MNIIPTDERQNIFCDYFVDTYINENATFPQYLRARCDISGERTTNVKCLYVLLSIWKKFLFVPSKYFCFILSFKNYSTSIIHKNENSVKNKFKLKIKKQ